MSRIFNEVLSNSPSMGTIHMHKRTALLTLHFPPFKQLTVSQRISDPQSSPMNPCAHIHRMLSGLAVVPYKGM